ncbi:MAG TPA: response regulator [Gemmatimonadales bacterium]|nr:response regulator [Gemmatimonadales bacterium]
MKLLVVEHPHVAGFIVQGLRDGGHAVDVTSDGDEALALGLSIDYDVILLAVVLPGRDGVDVASELHRAGRSAPILLLTPGDHDAAQFVRQASADGYVAKPFRFEILLERVRELAQRGN